MIRKDYQPLDVAQGLNHLLTDLPSEVIVLHSPVGLIHYASHSAPAIFGATTKMVGTSLLDWIHDDDRVRVKGVFTDATTKGSHVPPMTVRMWSDPSHELHWVVLFTVAVKDATGRVIELHTTFRDVTQQIALRDRIVEHDTLSHMTNRLARVGGWYHDIESQDFYWSEEVRKIHGVDADFEVNLDTISTFFSKSDFDRLLGAKNETETSGQPTVIEVPLLTPDDRTKWIRVFLSASYENGIARRIYGATQDITEIKEREEQLEHLVRELTHQRDRLEEFSHLVSHQLRAPLSNLTSLVSLLRESPDTDDRIKVETALVDAVQSLERTLEEVGEAVRIHNEIVPSFEKIYIRDLVLSVKAQLAQTLRDAGATIEIDTDEVPVIEYPSVYLESLLRHLISNGLRFADVGRPPVVTISTSFIEGEPVLEIADNGMGMDLGRHGDRLFRLGNTFHRNSSGRGVGLFMVKTMVESLGGEIRVHSTPGKGTTFTIFLHKHRAGEAV